MEYYADILPIEEQGTEAYTYADEWKITLKVFHALLIKPWHIGYQ